MSLCGGWSLLTHRTARTEGITLWCRSWLCCDCRPKRLGALKSLAASGHPTTLITLTVNPAEGENPETRARALSNAWKLVVKRARRKWTKAPLEYFAVFEETKKGEPHLHIIARAPYIPQRWLSDQLNELIHAPIVDIRTIKSQRHVVMYVAKYIAKGPRSFGTLKRYWHSKGFPLDRETLRAKEPPGCGDWFVVKRPLWMIVQDMASCGWDVSWENEHHFVHWNSPPSWGVVYKNPLQEER